MKVSYPPGVNPSQVSDARSSQQPGKARGGASSSNATRAGSQAAAQDSVTLTDAAKQLSSVSKSSGRGAPVNQKKVDAVRTALAQGTYQINPQRIANALISGEIK